MADNKKERATAVSELPSGIAELVDIPSTTAAREAKAAEAVSEPKGAKPAEGQPAESQAPAHAPAEQQERPRTDKEKELDALIAKRQAVIEQLKAKNPLVLEARKQLSELIPTVRGKGSSHAMGLVREEERLEFEIATEAYTPKKEKELLKRVREIRLELSKNKELDAARKAVDEKRNALGKVVSEIRSLEHALAEARKACDEKYAEVLSERRSAYEQRSAHREERKQKQFTDMKKRVREEHKRDYDDEVSKYLKDYDDTVSMDEIVQIERKDKKEKKEGKEEEKAEEKTEEKEE